MKKRFVIGDIHGRHKELVEVLKKSKFDYDRDRLIVLGDVCDGGYDTYKCVEELLKIKDVVYLLGNHCLWFIDHLNHGFSDNIWIHQGGENTLKSYGAEVDVSDRFMDKSKISWKDGVRVPTTHQEFFNNYKLWHIEKTNDGNGEMFFVHGGFRPDKPAQKQPRDVYLWDRDLIEYLCDGKSSAFTTQWHRIFVGHTTTQGFGSLKPIRRQNLIMMDTGAGWDGRLSIMDIDSEKFWQSKKVRKPIF